MRTTSLPKNSTLEHLRGHAKLVRDLTQLAERNENIPDIKAKSRHKSLRSLERYITAAPAATADLSNRNDPNRRHQ